MNAAILRQILGGAQSPGLTCNNIILRTEDPSHRRPDASLLADPATRNAAEEQLKQSFLTDPATHLTFVTRVCSYNYSNAAEKFYLISLQLARKLSINSL